MWHTNQECHPFPAAPVRLIKSVWHIQVIQLSHIPASWGRFQDPEGTEVSAWRRTRRHPEVPLNRAAQQPAPLGWGPDKYLMTTVAGRATQTRPCRRLFSPAFLHAEGKNKCRCTRFCANSGCGRQVSARRCHSTVECGIQTYGRYSVWAGIKLANVLFRESS